MSTTAYAKEFVTLLKGLRAVRQFSDNPLPGDAVRDIHDVIRWSGNASNRQEFQVLWVEDRALLQRLSELKGYAHHLAGAAAGAVVVSFLGSDELNAFDEGRIAERIMLAAYAHGIGSSIGWLQGDSRKEAAGLLGLPAGRTVRTTVSFGYPAPEGSEAGAASLWKTWSSASADGHFHLMGSGERILHMRLEGIHHVSSITGDAQANVDFYVGVLGLRMVKKTVNQDDPTVYHLFYGDDAGSPGFDMTFFEYPGAAPGRAGQGMIHRIVLRLVSEQALDFWERRIRSGQRSPGSLLFTDPEGLGLELRVVKTDDAPLTASHPEIPAEFAIQGFEEVRAYSSSPELSRDLLEKALEFEAQDGAFIARGAKRRGRYVYDSAPAERGAPGAGTVHHVAWASLDDEQVAWRDRVIAGAAHPTPVIDRFWFKSVYFREPSGVLFEIATMGPGFAVDEDPAHLGERLVLPPKFEHLRSRLETTLTPINVPAVARQ